MLPPLKDLFAFTDPKMNDAVAATVYMCVTKSTAVGTLGGSKCVF
jgi:hypothetical protein